METLAGWFWMRGISLHPSELDRYSVAWLEATALSVEHGSKHVRDEFMAAYREQDRGRRIDTAPVERALTALGQSLSVDGYKKEQLPEQTISMARDRGKRLAIEQKESGK